MAEVVMMLPMIVLPLQQMGVGGDGGWGERGVVVEGVGRLEAVWPPFLGQFTAACAYRLVNERETYNNL